jgi:hypothetical protein
MKDKLTELFEDHGCLAVLIALVIILAFAFGCLCFEGWLLMLLWNAVLVPLFGWSALKFWWAVGILLICNILFGGAKTVIHKGE